MKKIERIKTLAEKYLQNDISAAEREELLAWLSDDMLLWMWFKDDIDAASPEMDATLQQKLYERVLDEGREMRDEGLSGEANKPSSFIPHPSSLVRWLAAAVVAVVVGFAAVFALRSHSDSSGNASELVVKTAAGERSSVVLPDGTHVRLNALSSLSYDCAEPGGERIVNLQGEAFFEVNHDESRPFKVMVDGLEVQCLGTKFDVKSYADDEQAYVVLKEGSVRVSSATSSLLMQPNTCVSYDRATARMTEVGTKLENYLGWTTGEICYDNESLENIAKDLSRTFMVKVIVNSPRLKKETFTGYLGNTSLKGILNVLTKVSDIDYKFAGDSTIYIYEK